MSDVARAVAATDPLLRRPPFLAVLTQGLPLAIALASHALINLVDLGLIGRLGAPAVQAAHVASTWNFLPMIVGNCVSTALLARLSRRLGDGDRDGGRAFNLRAQWLMVWLGAVLGAATALPARWLVTGTGLDGAVGAAATHYLVVSNLGCLPMFVLMQTTAAMRAAGEALMPFGLLLLANLLNLLLDLVLLFGWEPAGIPAIGVVGAAYASVISRLFAAVLGLAWLWRRSHVLSLRGPRRPGPCPVARPLLADAWPQSVQILLRAGIVLALTILVQQHFGDEATVSLGVTTRLDTLVLFSSLGFANAATAYAGRAFVVGWHVRVRAAGLWAGAQAAAFGVGWVVLFRLEGPWLLELFVPGTSTRVVELATLYFATAAWAQVLGAFALGAIGAVHGAGRMVAPLVVDLVGFGIAGALLWSAATLDGALASYYLALVGGMAAVALAHLGFVLFGRWPRAQ